MSKAKKILLIEDHDWMRELYATHLEKSGFKTISTDNAQGALDAFDEHDISVVVLDIIMPHNNGLSFLYERQSYEDIRALPVIILSSLNQTDMRISDSLWRELDVAKFCYKPKTKPSDLVQIVSKLTAT